MKQALSWPCLVDLVRLVHSTERRNTLASGASKTSIGMPLFVVALEQLTYIRESFHELHVLDIPSVRLRGIRPFMCVASSYGPRRYLIGEHEGQEASETCHTYYQPFAPHSEEEGAHTLLPHSMPGSMSRDGSQTSRNRSFCRVGSAQTV